MCHACAPNAQLPYMPHTLHILRIHITCVTHPMVTRHKHMSVHTTQCTAPNPTASQHNITLRHHTSPCGRIVCHVLIYMHHTVHPTHHTVKHHSCIIHVPHAYTQHVPPHHKCHICNSTHHPNTELYHTTVDITHHRYTWQTHSKCMNHIYIAHV